MVNRGVFILGAMVYDGWAMVYDGDYRVDTYNCDWLRAINCDADVNRDWKINILDLIDVRNGLGTSNVSLPWDNRTWNARVDVDFNGKINILDMLIVRNNFGGECGVELDCVDSDGRDFDVIGNVIYNWVVYTDGCAGVTGAVEYICHFNESNDWKGAMGFVTQTCGLRCEGGLCIDGEATCVDSDYNPDDFYGADYFVKGSTYSTINGNFTDYCWEDSMGYERVNEYICKADGWVGNTGTLCLNGCFDGACL